MDDTPFPDNVTPINHGIALKDFEALGKEMLELKNKIDTMQRAVDVESEKLASLQSRILGFMLDHEKTEYIVEGMGKIAVESKESVQIPRTIEDKEAFFNWLKARDMFMEYVNINSQTLNRLYNDEMEAALARGELEVKIDGIGPPKTYQKIRITKARK